MNISFKFFLIILLFYTANISYAQESVIVDVQMPCGVAGTPACNVEIDTSGLPSPTLSASEPSLNPNFSLINIPSLSIEFVFPFQKTGCNYLMPSKTILNRSTSLIIDFCKVSNVINDVASILAYFFTAGYLINLAFKPRGD